MFIFFRCGTWGRMLCCTRWWATLTPSLASASALTAPTFFPTQWTTHVSIAQIMASLPLESVLEWAGEAALKLLSYVQQHLKMFNLQAKSSLNTKLQEFLMTKEWSCCCLSHFSLVIFAPFYAYSFSICVVVIHGTDEKKFSAVTKLWCCLVRKKNL